MLGQIDTGDAQAKRLRHVASGPIFQDVEILSVWVGSAFDGGRASGLWAAGFARSWTRSSQRWCLAN